MHHHHFTNAKNTTSSSYGLVIKTPTVENGRKPTSEAKALPNRNGGRVKATGMRREGGKTQSQIGRIMTSEAKWFSQPQRQKGHNYGLATKKSTRIGSRALFYFGWLNALRAATAEEKRLGTRDLRAGRLSIEIQKTFYIGR